MKAGKILLISQVVAMYLMQLPLYLVFIFSSSPIEEELQTNLIQTSIIISLALIAVVLPLCIANIVIGFISIFKGNSNPSKTVMVIKLVLMPWFAFNFVFRIICLS